MSVNFSKIADRADSYKHVLIIMRHAKAESSSPDSDEQRDITDKGRKQAKKIAKALKTFSLIPDVIACSGALRARSTAERLLKVFGDKPNIHYNQGLYENGMQAFTDELAATKNKVKTLMIVGHEPTVSKASQWLASENSKPRYVDALQLGFSPSQIVILGSNEPFSQWDLHEAEII